VIVFDRVTVTYADAEVPALRDVALEVPEGELCLVVGETGSGKSTLLRCVNGLVPHFSGGRLQGRVLVDGRDTRTHPPRELADLVGFVGQDPVSGFVADVVEDELAYGMESLGVAPDVMRRRVEDALDLLGLTDVRDRPLLSLSAGQQQRVAIGSVLTVHPRVLVLDEPTSALDPAAAEEVLAALTRLVHDLGITVLVAEHRLERVIQYADQVVHVRADGTVTAGAPAATLAGAPVAPPVVELGRLAGWSPLPLSVRDARRAAADLRLRLRDVPPPRRPRTSGEVVATVTDVSVDYDGVPALQGVSLQLRRGEVVALMGRNGAGKSTLLSVLAGLRRPRTGSLAAGGTIGLVPHEPADLLWSSTVADECAAADREAAAEAGTTQRLLARFAPDVPADAHPRDLSEGQRLSLAVAVILAAHRDVLLLDEPTRGLDYATKARLVTVLRDLADTGHALMVATHDVELVAELADRVVVLADGDVVADGPTADVIVSSPVFAPQVAKVLAPLPWLTVGAVAQALAG
jgi:energy-coupling factor transport system ATP-binding protein